MASRSMVHYEPADPAPNKPSEIRLAEAVVQTACRKQPLLAGLLTVGAGFSATSACRCFTGSASAPGTVFLYCSKGRGWCEAAERLHPVREGDLLILPAKLLHACRTQASRPWTIHWVHAVGARLPDYLRELQTDGVTPVFHLGQDPQIIRLFGEVLRSLQHGSDFVHLLRASAAFAYLLALAIQHRHERGPESSDTIQKVAEAIIYMSEHLDQPLRVSALARLASLSPAYFSELFKAQTGCSPREYLHLLRMHRACQLLEDTTWSVKQISAQIGYQDQFHFSRQFKAFRGLSPSQYRQASGS